MQTLLILSSLLLMITIKNTLAVVGQKCQYPAHSHIRLPGSSKRHYLECESSQVYEEKECPVGTEFDSVSMICIYKLKETSQIPIWNSAEEDEDEMMLFQNNKVASTKPPPQLQQQAAPFNSRQQPPQLVPQWPNSMPIELYSSCTTDAWCPHDPTKLQYCDVNGEQFMQCSGSGWILKDCPTGAIFTGPLGRCVDPRENLQPLTNPTPVPVSQITPQLFSGGIPNSKVISFGSNIVGSLPSPLLSGGNSNQDQLQTKQPWPKILPAANNQLPNIHQPGPPTGEPIINNNFLPDNKVPPGQSPQQPFAVFGGGNGLGGNNQQQLNGIENVQPQQLGFGVSQQPMPHPPLAVQPVPHNSVQQGGFGFNHHAPIFSSQPSSPAPAVHQIPPHIAQPVALPTASPITTPGQLPVWAQPQSNTPAPASAANHNFIIGGQSQQTLSLTPDQIAQLPRGQLIFIPANNDSLNSIQNAIQVNPVGTSQLKASNSQQQNWSAKNMGIVSPNQAPIVKDIPSNPWLQSQQTWQAPAAPQAGWAVHQPFNPQNPTSIHSNPLSSPWQNPQQAQWTMGNGGNNGLSSWKKLNDYEHPFTFLKANALRGLADVRHQKNLFKKLDLRLLRSSSN